MDHHSQTVNRPLVSIIMAAYNCGPFVRQAIESVCAQRYQNWELLIIDDASTDTTAQMIASVSDTRIRLLTHAKNLGIEGTRNEALHLADGKYVAVLDSDDVWLDEHKLETQVAFLEAHPQCVIVGTYITHISATGVATGSTRYATDDSTIRNRILIRNQFAHSSVLMRNDALKKTLGYRGELAEDLDLFLQLGNHGTFANIPEYVTGYRMHGTGASSRRLEMARAVHEVLSRHSNSYPNRLMAYVTSYLRLLLTALRMR